MLDAAIAIDGDVVAEALAGLGGVPRCLPPKLFYDAAGVGLFGLITRLPEYYLTRTEMALLARIAPEVVALAPAGAALVEYGASDEEKASLLLRAGGGRFSAFVPVDVASGSLAAMAGRLAVEMPDLGVFPVQADFGGVVALPAAVDGLPRFGFFPGSTIGNFTPAEAVAFLRRVRVALGADAWLIVGADLRKDPAILVPAYDDPSGVTAAFNLNVLHRLNREAGADFDVGRWAHRAVWNDAESRIEMHLVSLAGQTVHIAGHAIVFAAGETIHTENSYKHGRPAMAAMAAEGGWTSMHYWTDPAGLFAVHALRSAM